MPGPNPPVVEVTAEDRTELEQLVRRPPTGQQLAERARIVLTVADGLNNSEVSQVVGVDVDTVRKWRTRWCRARAVPVEDLSISARLADASRSGTPARISLEQACRIMALACEVPSASGRSIGQWSTIELAADDDPLPLELAAKSPLATIARDFGTALVLQPDGKLVAAGAGGDQADRDFAPVC